MGHYGQRRRVLSSIGANRSARSTDPWIEFEESPVIFVSDVLKHAKRRDAAEGSGDVPVAGSRFLQ